MRKITSILSISLLCIITKAGVVDHDVMFKAYLANDMNRWGDELTKYTHTKNLTATDKLDICNYLYGYAAVLMDKGDDETTEEWLKIMENYLNDLEKTNAPKSTLYVYRSSVLAFRSRMNKWKMISYANKSLDYLDKALEINSNDPLAVGLKGNVKFYVPALIGGSKKESIPYYERAIRLLKANPQKVYRWNLCAIELCLAQAYEKTGNKQKAIEQVNKIIEECPSFKYVRDTYLPALTKK